MEIDPSVAPNNNSTTNDSSSNSNSNSNNNEASSGRARRVSTSTRSKYEPKVQDTPPPRTATKHHKNSSNSNNQSCQGGESEDHQEIDEEADAAELELLAKAEGYEGIELSLEPIGLDRNKRYYWAFSFKPFTLSSEDTTEGSLLSKLCTPRIFAEYSPYTTKSLKNISDPNNIFTKAEVVTEWKSFSSGNGSPFSFYILS